ncbi:MAG: DUF3899 domain-containing protein [Lachnospiraceae bacterium]|jgi:hypothetical protein|nr:DUF3899 domain-containing protein [Lachnospiraceae bacterium]
MKKYLIPALLGAAAVLWVLTIRGFFGPGLGLAQRYMYLSDAFLVPGVMITGVGLLVYVSGEGGLDAVGYGLQFLKPRRLRDTRIQSYQDYKLKRAEKKTPCRFLLRVGAVYLLFSVLFTFLYFRA